MPVAYARRLTGRRRSTGANRHLGYVLALVAGATNAGGFLAVQQYTSHMTGIASALADHVAATEWRLAAAGGASMLAFMAGATCSTLMIRWARRRHLHAQFALPLMVEALLLLLFGVIGTRMAVVPDLALPLTVLLLCFIMGLQNAVITKVSRAEIRTTHVTGIVTDIGIEFGRRLSLSPRRATDPPDGAPGKLSLLTGLLFSFVGGGILGATGFRAVGDLATLPLALALAACAAVPAADDLRSWLRARRLRAQQ